MSTVNNNASSNFFPTTPGGKAKAIAKAGIPRNSYERQNEIETKTGSDAKVDIPEAIKDFSKIKKLADAAPERDNSAKIADLKSQIKNGTYKMDYDGLADKILQEEF